ncbi:uncharacterized protein LOC121252412 [Juglans microcarpa x Juglans regia]|uniref:uncharacterized protein LOC121252412 n=1 Tax=Juglans microcarpa x Juglans regia TaxID=2249226 RepID=UPI001B7DB983|nr:uncharacterized protein LOC121252412 [Juglans microcarpa x Juglans regia]
MASKYISLKTGLAILALALCFFVQITLGGITCEHLDRDTCAFAVSSSGKRCVLEKLVRRSGEEAYACRTSEIEADKLKGWIEIDQCIKACGLDRKTLGISSDFLLESRFTEKLCSPLCYDGCPNVVDLYFNLAAGEGVFLPRFCEVESNPRRGAFEILSSGFVAAGHVHEHVESTDAPIAAPALAPLPY